MNKLHVTPLPPNMTSQHLRDLCAETEFNRAQLIQPFFVVEGLQSDEPIAGLRGNVRLTTSSALRQIEKDMKALVDGGPSRRGRPTQAQRDVEIARMHEEEAKTFGQIGYKKNMTAASVEQAYRRFKRKDQELLLEIITRMVR